VGPRVALALSLLLWPGAADALTCARPPAGPRVLYPRSGDAVPRDVTIYIRPGGATTRRLALVQRKSGRETWLRVERQPGLWRLAPTRLLEPGQTYELRQLGELRRKPPTLLVAFRAAATVHRGGKPSFSKASLTFSPAGRRTMTRRAGRSATLELEADPAPVVVEVQLAFRSKGKWSATWRSAHGLAPRLELAGTHACDHERPVAPARGRYRAELIPWGPSGEKGQALTLKGVIR